MPKEIRHISTRTKIVQLLESASKTLRLASETATGKELLDAIAEAQAKVATAKSLAAFKPVGSRALPPAVRRATETAATRLEVLAQRVKDTPLTEREKSDAARYRGANGKR